ncbi:MAG TPA: ISL3 family transposase [Acidimicrobiales bacterium]|nr:ISL3 family transposase [Acidimicrobiales bacterium]
MGFERSDSAVAVLGMDGFVLLAAVEVDGELHQLVETEASVVGCSGCGSRALSKGRRRTKVRDLSCGGRPVVVVWSKRLWRCGDADCDVKTWSETSPLIASRASLTERARVEACRQVGRYNHAVAEVGRSLGVGWWTVMNAVRDYGEPLVDDPGRIGAVGGLGLDETAWLRANATRHTAFLTGFVDIIGGRLLDIVAGRSARVVEDWLAARPEAWLAGVHTVAIDPHRGYANGVAEKLAHATLVVDPFHAVRLANMAIDDVRRRVQQEECGHRGRTGDPLYGIRRLLLRGNERLSAHARARMEVGLAAGDPRDEVLDAWLAKEALRFMYAADTMAEAARRFDAFIKEAKSSSVPELHRLAKTMSQWRTQILAHHRSGASNGPTEAVNLLIKKVLRVAHGFRNLENYRLRLLLHCGVRWQTHAATRIRGRSPRLAA